MAEKFKITESKVVIIGAGKIAYSITAALIKNNIFVSKVISRTLASAKALADKFDVKYYSDVVSVIAGEENFFIICVPDTQIKNAAEEFTKLNVDLKSCLFIHTSGALSSGELKQLKKKGALAGSFHIMQTFPSKDIVPLKNCYASIESDNGNVIQYLTEFAKKLRMKSFVIDKKDKHLYHTSGVSLSNFLIANIYNSKTMFEKISGDNFDANEIIMLNIKTALKNIESRGLFNSLSGPLERGDLNTIKKHVKALVKLGEKKTNYRLTAYVSQSMILLDFIKERDGSLSGRHKQIKAYLSELI